MMTDLYPVPDAMLNASGQQGNITKPTTSYITNFFIGAITNVVVAIAFFVYVISNSNESGPAAIFLPLIIIFYGVVGEVLVLLSLLVTHFIRSQYKFIWLMLVQSLLILILALLPYTSEIKSMALMLSFSGLAVAVYNLIVIGQETVNRSRLITYFVISFVLSTAIIIPVTLGWTTKFELNASGRANIDLKTIAPTDILPGYDISYSEDPNSDEYHRINIDAHPDTQKKFPNYFSGSVIISLTKQNYDFSNKEMIEVDGVKVDQACIYDSMCNMHWKEGKYEVYIAGGMSGDLSSYIDMDDTKMRLLLTMRTLVSEIHQRSITLRDE